MMEVMNAPSAQRDTTGGEFLLFDGDTLKGFFYHPKNAYFLIFRQGPKVTRVPHPAAATSKNLFQLFTLLTKYALLQLAVANA
jgi:hypothetical protein